MTTESDLQTSLPLTETTFFILLSLASEPKHGYAIMKDVRRLSEQRVALSTGTLYGALKRLLDQRWIERVDSSEPDETGRPTKAYILTAIGRRVLDLEISRLQALVHAAHAYSARGQI